MFARKKRAIGWFLPHLVPGMIFASVLTVLISTQSCASEQLLQQNLSTKEIVSTIGSAYNRYRKKVGFQVPANTSLEVLKPYIKYVSEDKISQVQDHPGASNVIWDCSDSNITCLNMQAGGTLFWFKDQTFDGTSNTNGLTLYYDPDGTNVGTIIQSNPSVSTCFILYYDGHIVDRNNALEGTHNSYWDFGPCQICNPNWFNW